METVNAMANAAAKAVWGDSTAATEPVSGKTGNTSAGEPYDAGNLGTFYCAHYRESIFFLLLH